MKAKLMMVLFVGTAGSITPVGSAQVPGHHAHPLMPDQALFLTCRIEGGDTPQVVEKCIEKLNPTSQTALDQTIDLPSPLPKLRLAQYLPRAELRQRVEPVQGSASQPAVELAVEGPTQSYQFWLVANDSDHNRLISLIGTWRYMAVADADERAQLLDQWKTEYTRDPMLQLSSPDGGHAQEFAAKPGVTFESSDLHCKVRVREFYPHFTYDRETHKPRNESDKRLNPAALVEFERGGQREELWVFAKYPGFTKQDAERSPVRLTLICSIESKSDSPDFLLVTLARKTNESWSRHQGNVACKEIVPDEAVEIPGSQYKFHLTHFVPSGRLIEDYVATEKKGSLAALRLEIAGSTEPSQTIWLAAQRERVVTLQGRTVHLSFGPRLAAPTSAPAPAASQPTTMPHARHP